MMFLCLRFPAGQHVMTLIRDHATQEFSSFAAAWRQISQLGRHMIEEPHTFAADAAWPDQRLPLGCRIREEAIISMMMARTRFRP